jgi:hypothetical protein
LNKWLNMRGWIIDNQYHKNEKETGKLRMCGGAWSINLGEITDQGVVDIIYHTEKARYSITYTKAQESGFVRTFGGEPKLVVAEKYWQVDNLVGAQR